MFQCMDFFRVKTTNMLMDCKVHLLPDLTDRVVNVCLLEIKFASNGEFKKS